MVKRSLKGIVFDLDGTLVDSLATTIDAFNYGIKQLGGRKHTPEEIVAYFGPGEGEIFSRILGKDKAQGAYDAARAYLDAHMGKCPLFEGVPELLENLKSSGVPISIFTGRSWDTTELILKHHRLLDRFITVVANDHVSMPKPSPEGLYLAVSKMKLKPEDVLFVGDSPVDMHAARVGGATGVAALWDLMAKRDQLEPTEPKHWAEKPLHVWDIWTGE